jgi:microcystin-dependent protein
MDGRALSQTTYAPLFALLGTAWNQFDGQADPGAGLFRIPRSYGRTHVSAGTGNGLTNRTLGTAGGEESHALTTPEMPSHTHVQNSHGHAGSADTQLSSVFSPQTPAAATVLSMRVSDAPGGDGRNVAYANNFNPWAGNSSAHSHTITVGSTTATNQNTGGGGSHNNMQPWLAVNRIIRIA